MKIHQIKIDFNVTDKIKRYVYVYIIEGKYCYLIDSGVFGSESIIINFLKTIGKNITDIKGILLTHAHPNHIGTAAYFQKKTGCNIYASKGEKRWIEDIDLEFKERPIPNFYGLAGESSIVTNVVKDGDIITLEDNLVVKVVGTPGHSIDEVSYVINTSAFIGDSIPVKGDIPIYIDKSKTLDSLNKILALSNIDIFYPAWDISYTKDEMVIKGEEAEKLINLIDGIVRKLSFNEPNVDVKTVCQVVSKEMKMPFLLQNPLFKITVESHMG